MEKRLKIPTIVSIILTIVAFVLSLLPILRNRNLPELIPLIPGNAITDVIFSMLIPYLFMFLFLILGPAVAIFFLKLHKIIKLNKYDYFRVKLEKKSPGWRIILRSAFPGLFAVNIAIYVTLSDLGGLFYIDPTSIAATIEYASVVLGIPIASILILPLWVLESSGLMCSKRIESYNRPVTPDIESVAQFYKKLLKGYIGISTIISYSLILYDILLANEPFSSVLIVFIDPIVIIFLFSFVSLLFEIRAPKLKKRLFLYLEKKDFDTEPKAIKIE